MSLNLRKTYSTRNLKHESESLNSSGQSFSKMGNVSRRASTSNFLKKIEELKERKTRMAKIRSAKNFRLNRSGPSEGGGRLKSSTVGLGKGSKQNPFLRSKVSSKTKGGKKVSFMKEKFMKKSFVQRKASVKVCRDVCIRLLLFYLFIYVLLLYVFYIFIYMYVIFCSDICFCLLSALQNPLNKHIHICIRPV